jgi:hypothetical protein
MGKQDLRIFDNSDTSPNIRVDGVDVTLGQVFPVLADAIVHERSWLQDFCDEKIVLSPDLYEILTAYERLERRRIG